MKLNLLAVKDGLGAAKAFLKETRTEARKVVWPSRQYVVAATVIILIIVFATGAFVMLVDYALAKIFHFILK